MTINPSYADIIAREMGRDRQRDTEQWKLIQLVMKSKPSKIQGWLKAAKIRWQTFISNLKGKRGYIPISQTPKESPSQ